jgi:hypothetical protein
VCLGGNLNLSSGEGSLGGPPDRIWRKSHLGVQLRGPLMVSSGSDPL